jgi:cysteine desulfurase
LVPQINGGGQERRRRAGTENVPGIVGFATALQRAEERRESYVEHCTALRDQLFDGLIERVPFTEVNGHRTQRLANNVNLSFAFTEGESILLLLDQVGVCASSGSACASGSLNPSHVLMALGMDADQAHGSIRLTVGKDTSAGDVAYVLEKLPPMIERLRSVSPQWKEVAVNGQLTAASR